MSHHLDTNAGRESDVVYYPRSARTRVEVFHQRRGHGGRRPTKENTEQTAASPIPSWENALAGRRRVSEAAKRDRFTHISFALRR